ncbi:oxidoreductase [Candidatus Marinamargulisbacteria bacterium SCGC AG-414-C22]|nr:oxidoreductase [Candidatus Marinamargulisbacteria bacterium SCGC AG-414-C22]
MNICVIGAGRWGRNHIRTAYQLGVLGAVVESNVDAIAFVKETYPGVVVFESLDDAGALDFDAYTVAVPAEFHFEIAQRLLLANKHVLVEKPITLNAKDAVTLQSLAESRKVTLMVGHLLLFHPAILKIKEYIDNGKIGKLQYMYSNRLNLGTVRTEENSLWSFAPHDFSIFQYLTQSYPLRVNATGGAFLQPHIHDTTLTTLEYPHNVKGHIFVSWLHPFKEHRFVVVGSKGMLTYEDSSPTKELLFYEKGIDWIQGEPVKRDGATQTISYNQAQPLAAEFQHFMDCIAGKAKNDRISGKQGVDVLELLEQAQQSLDVVSHV